MAAHEQSIGATDEWYTPPWLFEKLGLNFSVDAASPGREVVPWIPAQHHITADSLSWDWMSLAAQYDYLPIWLNPPYGSRNAVRPWLEHLARTKHGFALVPNRTGCDWWQDFAQRADGLLFVRGKIRFLRPDGSEGASPGYGNVIMAFGRRWAEHLYDSEIEGFRTLCQKHTGETK